MALQQQGSCCLMIENILPFHPKYCHLLLEWNSWRNENAGSLVIDDSSLISCVVFTHNVTNAIHTNDESLWLLQENSENPFSADCDFFYRFRKTRIAVFSTSFYRTASVGHLALRTETTINAFLARRNFQYYRKIELFFMMDCYVSWGRRECSVSYFSGFHVGNVHMHDFLECCIPQLEPHAWEMVRLGQMTDQEKRIIYTNAHIPKATLSSCPVSFNFDEPDKREFYVWLTKIFGQRNLDQNRYTDHFTRAYECMCLYWWTNTHPGNGNRRRERVHLTQLVSEDIHKP